MDSDTSRYTSLHGQFNISYANRHEVMIPVFKSELQMVGEADYNSSIILSLGSGFVFLSLGGLYTFWSDGITSDEWLALITSGGAGIALLSTFFLLNRTRKTIVKNILERTENGGARNSESSKFDNGVNSFRGMHGQEHSSR